MDERSEANLLQRQTNGVKTQSSYYIDTIDKTMTISNPNDMGAIVLDNIVNRNKLATLIQQYTNAEIVLYTVDTHIITCITMNPHINRIKIEFNATIPNNTVDMLNTPTIKFLNFNYRNNEYIMSQLEHFKHLQSLSMTGLFDSINIAKTIDNITKMNLVSLSMHIMLDLDNETHLDKLFTAMSLLRLELTINSVQIGDNNPSALDNWVWSIGTNKTITYLSINYEMPDRFTDHLAAAIKTNTTIRKLELSNYDNTFDIKIIDAICKNTSIETFVTYNKFNDINSYIYLLQHSKVEELVMAVFPSIISKHAAELELALENNFNIISSGSWLQGQHVIDCNMYFERNKRLRYRELHKHLIEFALIFLRGPFDPYVIRMLFDEWYEPAGSSFYCAKKIEVLYGIRRSIERLNK